MNDIYLNDLGLINALGETKSQVFQRLLQHDQSGMVVFDVICGDKKTYVGRVCAELDILPDAYKKYNCRNNRLIVTA